MKTRLTNSRSITTITGAMALAVAMTLTPATAETARPGDYKIDPAHTSVTFTIGHLGISRLSGRFNTVAGNMKLAPGKNSSVSVSIDTASIDTNHKKRDDHLRSPDFFNARQFPKMTFHAEGIELNDASPQRIDGTLSLHDKTRPVTLMVEAVGAGKDPWGGYRAGYTATTTLKRSDFGMNFMPGEIADEVAITLNIEAIKQ